MNLTERRAEQAAKGARGPTKPAVKLELVRVYEDPGRSVVECRVLVDRVWPRGMKKDAIDMDECAKDAAPSAELRRWYGHDPARFVEFERRYRAELAREPAMWAVAHLRQKARRHRLVLLSATRDVEHSGAEVLRQLLASPTDPASSR